MAWSAKDLRKAAGVISDITGQQSLITSPNDYSSLLGYSVAGWTEEQLNQLSQRGGTFANTLVSDEMTKRRNELAAAFFQQNSIFATTGIPDIGTSMFAEKKRGTSQTLIADFIGGI